MKPFDFLAFNSDSNYLGGGGFRSLSNTSKDEIGNYYKSMR